MDANLMNISKIQSFFDSLLKGKLSKNIFYDALPETIKESWTDMVLVDFADSINDDGGYGKGYVNIFMYTKSLASGARNVSALNKMEAKLNEIIASNKHSNYFISRKNTIPDYDEQRKLHCSIVRLILQIF